MQVTPPPPELPPDALVEVWLNPQWGSSSVKRVVEAGWNALSTIDGLWYLDSGEDFDWTVASGAELAQLYW